VSERSATPKLAQSSEIHAEIGKNQATNNVAETTSPVLADTYVRTSSNGANTDGMVGRDIDAHASVEETTDLTLPILDEAAQIEERRKRREALKNKYRGQATPLRIQALHLDPETGSAASGANNSQDDAATPGNNSQVGNWHSRLTGTASPASVSPQTPKDTSGLQSPTALTLDKNEDIMKADAEQDLGEDGDEPSAADYDPTFDMQEERSRHDKMLFNEDMSMRDDQDEHPIHQAPDAATNSPPPQPRKDVFDMFAEDEDDDLDMFAEAPVKAAKDSKAESKIAQALDVDFGCSRA
jgi:serine/threonine-protein kinase PRP4